MNYLTPSAVKLVLVAQGGNCYGKVVTGGKY